MFKNICIIGAGNIGSRHLQALAKISQPLSSNRLASGHIALTVENLDALYKTLVAGGYECNSAPLLAPGGKTKILYCHDPDGIIIELIEDLN